MSDETTEDSVNGAERPHKTDYTKFLAIFSNVHTRSYIGKPLEKRIARYSVVSFAALPAELLENAPKSVMVPRVYTGVHYGNGFVESGTPTRILKVHGEFDPSYENMVVDHVKKERIMEEYPDTSGIWDAIKNIPDFAVSTDRLLLASDLINRLNKQFRTRAYIAIGQNLFTSNTMFMCAATAHNLGMRTTKANPDLPGCPIVFYNDKEDYLLCMPKKTGDMYRSEWTNAYHDLTIYEPLKNILYGTSIMPITRYLRRSHSWLGTYKEFPRTIKDYYARKAAENGAS